jgi:hypothetical protein
MNFSIDAGARNGAGGPEPLCRPPRKRHGCDPGRADIILQNSGALIRIGGDRGVLLGRNRPHPTTFWERFAGPPE